ncbi:enoyl-[acyl-carrier-protein] reductase, mitochondrial [Aethina tumida]|uniref:enoyl-[acyl-carrier-protein] reductase, mitochondrial n=1 Tax=Aethina tumida TaxID=116153 RepID=UPI00096ADF7E|nr:enoyl-[acyl-carrier-protein] reductase, mitochondrial [Aethina tumida]
MSTVTTKILKILKPGTLQQTMFQRFNSVQASKLIYTEYGDPIKVIQKEPETIPDPKDDEVLIKMLAAPVNPADINTIQGKYPSKPQLPAVPGNEGVAKVICTGPGVSDLSEGDHVVPLVNNLGTWRTHAVLKKEHLLKVPKKLGLIEAATLTVNPCTAFRMLRDFTCLKPGDTVIQNGANSACGQNVIQICRSWGIRTVNVVRDRPDLVELKRFLTKLGATEVLTEDELRKTDIFKSGKLAKPKLALNCVGGQNALECMRHLQNGAPMVTYGGMSREPVTVPTSALIFKDIQVRGFWMTRWSKENASSVDRLEMFEELISLMTNNELQGPAYKMVNFENYREALMNTMTIKGMIGKKFILDFENC